MHATCDGLHDNASLFSFLFSLSKKLTGKEIKLHRLVSKTERLNSLSYLRILLL